MNPLPITDTNIESSSLLLSPVQIKEQLPLTDLAAKTVVQGRESIKNILDGNDPRRFLIVGPCSIHDVDAAIDYASRLKRLADQVQDQILVVMRAYFEKPRTTVGWKGLINDPDMDGSFNVQKGLLTARQLLITIAELGLPTATEALDPITPQYLSDLISWAAIGARTTESQTHREMASGLSMPVGFKNGTDGNINIALDAIQSCRTAHQFLGIDQNGRVNTFRTKGNPYGHLILRGGKQPNYDAATIAQIEAKMSRLKLPQRIVVDCSHGNSNKNYERQGDVMQNILQQISDGNRSVVGMMLESNLAAGNQKVSDGRKGLQYGISITDPCIGWKETEDLVYSAYQQLGADKNMLFQSCGMSFTGTPLRNLLATKA
ncbi:3-deoxy-7-phosphoheptulonate synthase [filamentous cyanobacterium CCT1]|nr:3-deoxy-7-phosphoheptulonate synthase [filamentous cyanobacterium CCT1]PSN79723.1 3-deoxy-7-phosphoheptulonate synthase [filamentous cyanobacterium CCP4]